jgi:hypothetical protein
VVAYAFVHGRREGGPGRKRTASSTSTGLVPDAPSVANLADDGYEMLTVG